MTLDVEKSAFFSENSIYSKISFIRRFHYSEGVFVLCSLIYRLKEKKLIYVSKCSRSLSLAHKIVMCEEFYIKIM